MRKTMMIAAGATLVMALGLSSVWAAETAFPIPFSADFVVTGETEERGSWFAGSEGLRLEGQRDGEPYVMIINVARGMVWNVLEQERMYLETPFDREGALDEGMPGVSLGTPCPDPDGRATRLGRETLQGRAVEKWRCEDLYGAVTTVWFDERLRTPIRTDDGEQTFELRTIRERSLSADLFRPPGCYTKVDLSIPGMTGPSSGLPPSPPPDASPPAPEAVRDRDRPPERDQRPDATEEVMRGIRDGIRGIMGR